MASNDTAYQNPGLERPYSLLRVSVFRTFGIEPCRDVTFEQCKHIYRKVMLAVHPDRFLRPQEEFQIAAPNNDRTYHFPFTDIAKHATGLWDWLSRGGKERFAQLWQVVWQQEHGNFNSLWNLNGRGPAMYKPIPGCPDTGSLDWDVRDSARLLTNPHPASSNARSRRRAPRKPAAASPSYGRRSDGLAPLRYKPTPVDLFWDADFEPDPEKIGRRSSHAGRHPLTRSKARQSRGASSLSGDRHRRVYTGPRVDRAKATQGMFPAFSEARSAEADASLRASKRPAPARWHQT